MGKVRVRVRICGRGVDDGGNHTPVFIWLLSLGGVTIESKTLLVNRLANGIALHILKYDKSHIPYYHSTMKSG